MAYIYSISQGGRGYIGLGTGSGAFADYSWRLGTMRERLDRMLQHIDNAYGLPNSYHLNDGILQTETSVGLNTALRGGAYKCEFYYNDDAGSCYGVGSEYFDRFSLLWRSSQKDPRMNFAELVYVYLLSGSFSSWNNKPGSQGKFVLQHKGIIAKYPGLSKKFQDLLKEICPKVTWGATGKENNEQGLRDLFYPEILLGKTLASQYEDSFLSLEQYRNILVEGLKDQNAWVFNAKTGKIEVGSDAAKEALLKYCEHKIKELASFKKDLAKMGLLLETPNTEDLKAVVDKIMKGLLKSGQQEIRISNLIKVSVSKSFSYTWPDWMPQSINRPNTSAEEVVKLHCANKALHVWDKNKYWPTVDKYTRALRGLQSAGESARSEPAGGLPRWSSG